MKLLFSKRDVYRETYTLYQYNSDTFRVVLQKYCKQKGFEEQKKNDFYIPRTESSEIERISLSRTKRRIREIALCNDFEYFATITVNSEHCDRFSLNNCQDLLRKQFHKLKRKNKDFAFVFITEKHKNGAFHFHGLVKGISDFYINKNGYLSHSLFDSVGFNSFSKIKDYNKCCNYITKYITKDCVKNEDNQIYFCSRGLKRPLKYNIKPITLNWGYENDFCKIKDFRVDELKNDEILNFLYINEGK